MLRATCCVPESIYLLHDMDMLLTMCWLNIYQESAPGNEIKVETSGVAILNGFAACDTSQIVPK